MVNGTKGGSGSGSSHPIVECRRSESGVRVPTSRYGIGDHLDTGRLDLGFQCGARYRSAPRTPVIQHIEEVVDAHAALRRDGQES